MVPTYFDYPIIKGSGCIFQCLANVIFFQFRVFFAQVFTVWIQRHQFDDTPDCQTQVSETGLPIHGRLGSLVIRSNFIRYNSFQTFDN